MKLHEFFEITSGSSRQLSISEMDEPMCPHDFWKRYSGKSEWFTDIESVNLIPKRRDNWCDTVICLINLKVN